MNTSQPPAANRILIVDDNPAIHTDFRKILAPEAATSESLQEAERILFGEPAPAKNASAVNYQLESAYQGQEGLALVEKAAAENRPFALAFMDVRMPPGWDGIETIRHIWARFPELPVVVCTAFSDYSWTEMMERLGHSDNLVILRKPFEPIEVLQLAHSLTHKWQQARQIQAHIQELDSLVAARTRKLAETNEALRRSEKRFSKAFQANPVPLLLLDTQTQHWTDVNASLLELLNLRRQDLVGQSAQTQPAFTEPHALQAITKDSLAGQPVQNRQLELVRPDQTKLTVLASAEMFELEGQPHLLLSLQDITLRIKMENQIREAQKMEVVSQIAAGVAHDFNNILTVIQGHAELQLDNGTPDPSVKESFEEIIQAANRAANLVRQLLAFSRKQMLHPRPLEVEPILHEFTPTLGRLLSDQIAIEIRCAPGLPVVYADAINFQQVLINLTLNARDAMPQGGSLTIAAEPFEADDQYRGRVPEALPGRFVRFSVTDTGTGMSEAVRRKVFEPFFTTKEVGQGTGLGLSSVYGIIKQHQGWLEVESTPGNGSTFRFYLPVSNSPPRL
jgi:two-component system, cell cycle sensor histidine kinase and response regulator CckA